MKASITSSATSSGIYAGSGRWLALICALAGFCLYANTIGHEYALDDVGAITGNEYVTQGISGIPKIMGTGLWHFENANLGYYRPLSMITFAVENQFFPGNPHVSHLGNVILYALTGFFLCLLLMNLFANIHPAFSFIITLLFMAHPIHTEVVANIKSRDELLAFLNLIIALLLLLRAYKTNTTNYKLVFVSCIFFYLALLSKETAMTGLLIAPLILFFSSNLTIKESLKKAIPFLVVIMIFQIHKYEVMGTTFGTTQKDIVNYPYTGAGIGLPTTMMIFLYCIRLIVFPHPLTYDYSYNQIPAVGWGWEAIAGIMLAAALLYFAFNNLKKKSVLSFGILFFLITIVPALAFAFFRGGILGERFLYAPALGFSIVIVYLMAKLFKEDIFSPEIKGNTFLKMKSILLPVALILILYSFKTIARNSVWKDNMTLFSTDVNTSSNSCHVHKHYGSVLLDLSATEKDSLKKNELISKGFEHLRKSLSINPHFADAFFEFAYAYQNYKVNVDSAVFYYNRDIEESPGDARAYNNLGTIYESLGSEEMASYCFYKAVETNPYLPDINLNRDKHKKRTGLDIHELPSRMSPEAIEKTATNKDATFYFKLATNLALHGDYARAATYFEKAIAMDSTQQDSYFNLASCYGMLGKYKENIETINKLLKINPNDAQAYTILATTYDKTGDERKANECRAKAKKLAKK